MGNYNTDQLITLDHATGIYTIKCYSNTYMSPYTACGPSYSVRSGQVSTHVQLTVTVEPTTKQISLCYIYVGPWAYYYSGQILIAIITIAIADCKADSHLYAATGPNMATLTYVYKEKILSLNHQ